MVAEEEQLAGERVGGPFQARAAGGTLLVTARPLVSARCEAEVKLADFEFGCVRYACDDGPRLDYFFPVAAGLGDSRFGQVAEFLVQPGSDGDKPVASVCAAPNGDKALVDRGNGVHIAEAGNPV